MMLPTVKGASNCQKSIYLEKDASNRQIEMLPTIKDASDGVRKKNSRRLLTIMWQLAMDMSS